MNILTEHHPDLPGIDPENKGAVYIIHFAEPFHHAQHYIGWAKGKSIEERLEKHQAGNGSRLMRAIVGEGIKWEVSRVFYNVDRYFERWLKNQHRAADFCPVCTKKPRQLRFKKR